MDRFEARGDLDDVAPEKFFWDRGVVVRVVVREAGVRGFIVGGVIGKVDLEEGFRVGVVVVYKYDCWVLVFYFCGVRYNHLRRLWW